MATYTPNINLKKPTTSENYNLLDWNDNSDKIDTAIGNLQTNNIVGAGTAIPESANLNSYTTMGSYYSSNAARSATIINTPFTTAGFRLFVVPIGPNGRMQIMIPNDSYIKMFFRRYDGSTWQSSWTEFNSYMHIFQTVYTSENVSSCTFDIPAGKHGVLFYAGHMSSLFNNDNSYSNIFSGGDSFADAGFTITKSGSTYTLTRTNGNRFSWGYYWL